jgi:DNA polymerase-3 subunit epsilon
MREIVLDTETTGLDPADGHRVVEVGCVELVNGMPTGRRFHRYLNPERPMSADAVIVHGLTDAFLGDKPVFAEVVQEFLDFIREDPLVIHNAEFDMKFLNAELGRLGFKAMPPTRAVDTVRIVRQRFPGAQASLDALCRRYGIDNTNRTLHGALLDAELLAEVYLELTGGRQPALVLVGETAAGAAAKAADRPRREPRPHMASPEECAAHQVLLARITAPIWLAA